MCEPLSVSSQNRSRWPQLAVVWPTCRRTSRRKQAILWSCNLILQRDLIHEKKRKKMRYLSWTLQVLSWNRQGSDKHGDTAQHEHRPHEAAHPPQENGPRSSEMWVSCATDRLLGSFRAATDLCLWSSRTSIQILQRITPHASAMANAQGILGTLRKRTTSVLK